MKHGHRSTIAVFLLSLFAAAPALAGVPEDERVPIIDPDALRSMGFPPDARNVYVRTVPGHSLEETRDLRDFGVSQVHYTPIDGSMFVGELNLTAEPWHFRANSDGIQRRGVSQFAHVQIPLPSGAVLQGVRWWAFDVSSTGNMLIHLLELCMPAFSGGVTTVTALGSATTTGSNGLESEFISIAPLTVDNLNCTYRVRVQFGAVGDTTPPSDGVMVIQKVRAQWQRQISTPPVTPTFGDVPTNHPFFQFIEALVSASVTGGCHTSPLLYCPDAPVTRGQMAVFISRALGLNFP